MVDGYIKIAAETGKLAQDLIDVVCKNFGSVITIHSGWTETDYNDYKWSIVELVIDLKRPGATICEGTSFKITNESIDFSDENSVDEFLNYVEEFFDIKRNPENAFDEHSIIGYFDREKFLEEEYSRAKENFISYATPHDIKMVWSKDHIEYSHCEGALKNQDFGAIKECVRDAFAPFANKFRPASIEGVDKLIDKTCAEIISLITICDQEYDTELTKEAVLSGLHSVFETNF